MRNLKKVLSLTLALVMMLSMMTFAGAAETTKVSTATDLTDMKDVANKEAVTLLVDLKVVAGRDNNTFDPAGSLKRAEFAKLIYVAKMGSDDKAANFVGAATGLTDVAGTWFEGYVNYAYSTGIVSGTSKTTFTPAGLVKVAEAAKMLLVGLGYDAKAEGYTDNALWSVNVMQQARQTGLLDGIKLGANAVLTRDAAAQMVFNALMAKTVSVTYAFDMNGKKYITGATVNKTTWGEEIFDLVKVEGIVDGINGGKAIINGVVSNLDATPAVIGCNAVYYKNSSNGKLISTALVVGNSQILGTVTSGVAKLENLMLAANEDFVALPDTTAVAVTYYKNGALAGDKDTAALVGSIVELIDNNDNGKVDVVRVTEKTIDVVGEKGVVFHKATIAGKVDGVDVDGIIVNKPLTDVIGYEGLKADDVVLCVTIAGKTYIEKAASVTGSVTGRKSTGYVLGGNTYPLSGLTNHAVDGDIEYGKDSTLYLDDNKSIAKFALNEKAAPAQYAAISDLRVIPADTNKVGVDAKEHTDAVLVYADGTSAIKTISTINGCTPIRVDGSDKVSALPTNYSTLFADANTYAAHTVLSSLATSSSAKLSDATGVTLADGTYYRVFDGTATKGTYVGVTSNVANKSSFLNAFYTYTENKDGTVALKSAEHGTAFATSGSTTTYYAGAPVIGTATVNNETIFLYAKDGKFTKYDGITKMPKVTSAYGYAVSKTSGGIATHVFLLGTIDTTSAENTAYITDTDFVDFVPKNGDVAAYYTYSAIVNGKITTVKADAANKFGHTGIYTLTFTDGIVVTAPTSVINHTEGGKQSATTAANGSYCDVMTGTKKDGTGTVKLGSNLYLYNADTKVFYIATDGKISAMDPASITTDTNDKVIASVIKIDATDATKNTLKTVYIEAVDPAADGANPGGGVVAGPHLNSVELQRVATAMLSIRVKSNEAATADLNGTFVVEKYMESTDKWVVYAGPTAIKILLGADTATASTGITVSTGEFYRVTVTMEGVVETVHYSVPSTDGAWV